MANMTMGTLGIGGCEPCGMGDTTVGSDPYVLTVYANGAALAANPAIATPSVMLGTAPNLNVNFPSAIDWSNPNGVIAPGDTLPSGDTYAGAPITVAEAQQTPGLLLGGTGAISTPAPVLSSTLIAAAVVVGALLVFGKGR